MKKTIMSTTIFVLLMSSALAFDFNNDNVVDFSDLILLIQNLGGSDTKYDVNSDAHINFYDLVLEAKNFGDIEINYQEYDYDVVVVGAGSGGIAAAIQAARMDVSVALIEETDYIGGQIMSVPTMDEGGADERKNGLYSEFTDKVVEYYGEKPVDTCYWGEGSMCMEPFVANNILNEMINEENIDIYLNKQISSVIKSGDKVTGIRTSEGTIFNAKIVVDATEYGDIIPMTGARYRIGNTDSDNIDFDACIQDITYTAIVRKYLDGAPDELIIKTEPPSYLEFLPLFEEIVTPSASDWPLYPTSWNNHNAYRGLPDSLNPDNYNVMDLSRITQTGINWANDYPQTSTLSTKYLEDKDYRKQINCEAKLKTLNFLYYMQQSLGEDWTVSNNQGFDTDYNINQNKCDNIPSEYDELLKYFPVIPYVRESRRIVPVRTLVAGEIKREGDPPRTQTVFKSSLAVGNYPNDLHNCKTDDTLELEFESSSDVAEGFISGPFQIPFESFIPEKIDGLLVAEKNIGVSRLVSGATRLQPITMATGQAVGTIAALSIKKNINPRDIAPLLVQIILVDSGAQISIYSYDDVPKENPNWKYVQMVSTHEIMIGYDWKTFGIDNLLTRAEMAALLGSYLGLSRENPPETPTFEDVSKDTWYYPHVEAIYEAGITAGCSAEPKLYCPENHVTRAEMAVFIVRIVGETPYDGTTESFSDVSHDDWFYVWVEKINQMGIITGYPDGTFEPERFMTRAEVAEAMYNALIYKEENK